jgi:hypothetical protein
VRLLILKRSWRRPCSSLLLIARTHVCVSDNVAVVRFCGEAIDATKTTDCEQLDESYADMRSLPTKHSMVQSIVDKSWSDVDND